jgi:TPR repeat protein
MRGTFLLGQLFLRGKLAASKNRTFSLLKKAALGGQNEAYFCLGSCYETGVGTDVSIPMAVDCYRRSAKNGSKVGMYSLGYLLVQNAIEMRRQVKLLRPYALANRERKGYADSAALVESSAQDEKIALMSAEAEAALQEGIHWLRAASENHVKDAAFQLGRLYEQVSAQRLALICCL